jgi:uncharacterized membrane protein
MNSSLVLLVLLYSVLLAVTLVVFLPHPRSWTRARTPADRPVARVIDRDDDRHWLGGLLYYNPDDPEPFVPKRFGFGWTINFAHPAGKVILAALIGTFLLPIVLAVLGVHLTPIGCHPSGCSPAP